MGKFSVDLKSLSQQLENNRQHLKLCYVLLALPLIYVLYRYIRFYLLHPLRNVPGPKLYALFGLPIMWKGFIGQKTLFINGLHKKYGNIVRIAPNEVSTCDFEAFQTIYAQGTNFTKTDFYRVITVSYDHPALFALSDKTQHSKRRRLLSHAFARSSILALEEFVTKESHTLVKQFSKLSLENKSIDLLQWYRFFTADVIIQGAFGLEANMVKMGEVHKFLQYMDATVFMWYLMYLLGPFYYVFEALSAVLPDTNSIRFHFTAIEKGTKAFADQCVKNYLANWNGDTQRKDIISKMLLGKDPETGERLDLETIGADAANLIVAGTDTTSTTLTYFSYEMIRNPRIRKRLQDELDEAIPDINQFLPFTSLEKLPLLRACIRETLRLHPAAPSTMPRVVPKSGITVKGHYIPPGTVIGTQVWDIHRLEEIWGKDVNDWNPDRWLKADTYQMEKALVPFSMGPQNCLGMNVAYLELFTASAYYVKCFDGEMDPNYPADGMDWVHFFLTVPKAHSCLVRLKPRIDLSQLTMAEI